MSRAPPTTRERSERPRSPADRTVSAGLLQRAEREGFEPSEELIALQRLSKPPQSTTLPPLLRLNEPPRGSGGCRIRTCGPFRVNGFQDRRNRPLCQPS